MTEIVKIAILQKKKNKKTNKMEWCLLSKKRPHRVLKWFGSKKPSKERYLEEERRVQFFKHKRGEIIEKLNLIAGELNNMGMIHLADSLTDCVDAIASEKEKQHQVPIKLGKVANILDHKGEYVLAEQLDEILPELLTTEAVEIKNDIPEVKYHMTADKAYKMATKFRIRYACGEIDESSAEYSKMQELQNMLQTGFLMPPPVGYKVLPTDSKNWWEHFSKGAK
jgi:hypothetical protein